MSNKGNKVKDILKAYGLYNDELARINYHLNIFGCDLKTLITKLSKNGIMVTSKNITEEEMAYIIEDLIRKCDMNNPEYDSKIDEEMTRIGHKTDQFDCSHKCSKWNNGMLSDDGYGTGSEIMDIYDSCVDSMNESVKVKSIGTK